MLYITDCDFRENGPGIIRKRLTLEAFIRYTDLQCQMSDLGKDFNLISKNMIILQIS